MSGSQNSEHTDGPCLQRIRLHRWLIGLEIWSNRVESEKLHARFETGLRTKIIVSGVLGEGEGEGEGEKEVYLMNGWVIG